MRNFYSEESILGFLEGVQELAFRMTKHGIIFLSGSLGASCLFQEDFETDGTGTRYTAPNQFADVGSANLGHSNDYWGRILANQLDGAILRGVYVMSTQADKNPL